MRRRSPHQVTAAVRPFFALTVLAFVGVSLPAACSLTTEGTEYTPSDASSAVGTGGAATTGASQASSGSVGSTGSTSGTGGTGGTDPENCYDGEDNDGDGAVDCADTQDCEQLVECITAAPIEGGGYARYTKQAFPGGDEPPACPDGNPALVYYAGPSTPETQCSKCSCEWQGAECTAPKITCYKDTKGCNKNPDFNAKATDTNCIDVSNFVKFDDASCKLIEGEGPVVQKPGACVTDGGKLNPAWDEVVYVCLAPPKPGLGGCDTGQACVPKGGGAFAGPACAAVPSAEPCPTGWNKNGVQAYLGAEDTRTCTNCGCETGVTCLGGSYEVFADNDCTLLPSTVNSVDCKEVSDQLKYETGSMKPTLATPQPGTCGGGAPMGTFNTLGPLALCCP